MVFNNTCLRLAIAAAALFAAYPAYSQEAAPDETAPLAHKAEPVDRAPGLHVKPHVHGQNVGALGQLYEQRLLIKAQVELINAQAQLKNKGVTTAKIAESYAPTVKMVQGVGNNLFATFLYPGDMAMDARVGETISGGYKVESISVNQVVLSKDGEQIRLGFSASPPTPLPALDNQAGPMSPMAGNMGSMGGFR
ncbi:type IV pilus biogenesis protein PilP [Castellaniella sp.]|uniref:type IV pilus biogenesis protein PilP n=1 Tax=Castellaniella sp. TaxID=1955812 RepID=UPI002B0015B9|nr:type IV pilus biogenesis protein PilP [Castellaniella sp.]